MKFRAESNWKLLQGENVPFTEGAVLWPDNTFRLFDTCIYGQVTKPRVLHPAHVLSNQQTSNQTGLWWDTRLRIRRIAGSSPGYKGAVEWIFFPLVVGSDGQMAQWDRGDLLVPGFDPRYVWSFFTSAVRPVQTSLGRLSDRSLGRLSGVGGFPGTPVCSTDNSRSQRGPSRVKTSFPKEANTKPVTKKANLTW